MWVNNMKFISHSFWRVLVSRFWYVEFFWVDYEFTISFPTPALTEVNSCRSGRIALIKTAFNSQNCFSCLNTKCSLNAGNEREKNYKNINFCHFIFMTSFFVS